MFGSETETAAGWKTYMICLALIITILFRINNPLQYYVKYTVYFTMTMTYALLVLPFVALRPNNSKNIEWVSATLGNMLRIFGMSFEIENEHYLQINQPYILLVNHQSELDFITMMNPLIWPGGKCTPLAKKELLVTGPFGLACWLCGITFVDRLNREKSRNTMNKLAQRINQENLRVWIYPEGTRSAKPDLLPFKKGAFHLAIEAQVPIVCMVTSSYSNFFSKSEKKFDFGGHVKCRVLPPFQTKGMNADSVNQLVKLLQSKMQKEFDNLNEEIGLEEKYRRVKNEDEQSQDDLEEENDFEHLDASVCENMNPNESISKDYSTDLTADESKKSI